MSNTNITNEDKLGHGLICPACGRSDAAPLLRVVDLAKLLRVSVRQVFAMRRAGVLPAGMKIGGSLRWRQSDIDVWLKRQLPRLTVE